MTGTSRLWIGCFLLLTACREAHVDVPKARPVPTAAGNASIASQPTPSPPAPVVSSEPVPAAPPPDPLGADLDPDNDLVVAPPDAIPSCQDELTRAGVTFLPSELPLKQNQAGGFACGAHDAIVYQKGPTGLSISPPALMTCRMALALVRLEMLLQEVAQRELGTSIKRAHQVGTYSCRKMVRFDFVSEHSYGNAIDIGSFTLADGRKVSVKSHFGKLDAEPPDAKARFLREVGSAAFDRDIVSVSLGPYWDTLHRDHFHFDMARYRVDGSRPSRAAGR
jgi:hypothetical protein